MGRPSRMKNKKIGARPAWTALALAAALMLTPAADAADAAADASHAYADHAKATIAQLLNGRAFKPEGGCGEGADCAALLAKLRQGDFAVIEPVERSDRPDMPSYLHLRKRCRGLDPLAITVAHRPYAATRDFAVYRLEIPVSSRRRDEVLVFRGEHYVLADRGRGAASQESDHAALIPGTYVAIAPRGCRLLSTAQAEDGDWLAKHNAIGSDDHASELLRIGGSYVVLNLAPIAGPQQPKASWWYTLELWDLGPHADADRRHQRRVYSFGYRPGAVPADVKRARTAGRG